MKLSIDTDARTLTVDGKTVNLYSDEAFAIVSREWVNLGWNQKYPYTFSWMGRPIIQLPEDMVRMQEVIYHLQPDVIVETGIAHGGSLIYYASLFKAMGKAGRVVGVDIEIRPHNRQALESHELAGYLTLIEGSSTAPEIVAQVRAAIRPDDRVLVILDSNHTYSHVAAELEIYAPLVTPGSYIVATDGLMQDLAEVPRGQAEWREDNPARAARDFAAGHSEFALGAPTWPFNESTLTEGVTHWPDAWLRRVR